MAKILVTGGAGFIGSHVADYLIQKDHDVFIIDNLSRGKRENLNNQAEFYKIDIRDFKPVEDILKKNKIDYVFHLAAQVSIDVSIQNPIFDTDINVLGTVNLLQCSQLCGVKKFIYSSSAAVYGEPAYLPLDEVHPLNPQSFYGLSKYIGEEYVRMFSDVHGLNFTILRYSNVYGPRQYSSGEGGVVAIFTEKFLKGERPFIFGDGKQTRDFIYVGDIAAANYKALFEGDRQTLNISTGTAISIFELYNELKFLTGIEKEPVYEEERKGDIKESCLDNKKAKRILQWEPQYSLEDGLKETVNYFKGKMKL